MKKSTTAVVDFFIFLCKVKPRAVSGAGLNPAPEKPYFWVIFLKKKHVGV
jgi:hypothetical protein